jgi:hypothetical protein
MVISPADLLVANKKKAVSKIGKIKPQSTQRIFTEHTKK